MNPTRLADRWLPSSSVGGFRSWSALRFATGLKRVALGWCPGLKRVALLLSSRYKWVTFLLRSGCSVWVALGGRTDESVTHRRLEILNVKREVLVRFF